MKLDKYTKPLIFVGLFYVVPLLWNPIRIIHLQILILMLSCYFLFITQPPIDLKEAKEKEETDKNSYYAILIAGTVSQVTAVIEWGYFRNPTLPPHQWPVVAIGFFMILGGLLFRFWSIQILGDFFTAAVESVEGHELITDGPYKWVRHPSYLGSYLAVVGAAVFLTTVIGTLVAAVAMFYAYRMRIAAEEDLLLKKFGDAYKEYMSRVPYKMFPKMW